jgi:hypothetical protein
VRLAAIAAAAEQIKAESFTIDGEAVVLGRDGLSRFEELRSRDAAHAATLYAFDLIEHDGEDTARMRWRAFCAIPRLVSYSTNTSPRTALSYSRTLAGLAPRASCRRSRWHLSIPSLSSLDQGTQSRRHRRAAGEERNMESMSLRQRAPDEDRLVSELMALRQ